MDNFVFKTQPLKHQLEALKQSIDKPAFALLLEMGTGKTKVTIDTFVNWHLDKKIDSLLVIAPKGIYLNWIEELKKHCYITIGIENHLGQKWGNTSVIQVYLINIEAITTDKGWKFVDKLVNEKTMLVIDESTKIKNPKA